MCMCVYACMCVCMYVCIHLSIYLLIYLCMYLCMDVRMDGGTDGSMDVWMYGCLALRICGYGDMWIWGYVDVWMYGCVDVCVSGCMDVCRDGRMDGLTDGCMDGCMEVSAVYIYMDIIYIDRERESYLGDRIATDDMCSFTLSLLSVDTVAGNCDLNLNYWVACVCPWKDGKIGEVRLSQSQTTSAWTILPTSTRDHIHIENTQGKVLISCSMTKGFILKQAGWKQETKQQSQLISINQL